VGLVRGDMREWLREREYVDTERSSVGEFAGGSEYVGSS
jgi:hypothetical protein